MKQRVDFTVSHVEIFSKVVCLHNMYGEVDWHRKHSAQTAPQLQWGSKNHAAISRVDMMTSKIGTLLGVAAKEATGSQPYTQSLLTQHRQVHNMSLLHTT